MIFNKKKPASLRGRKIMPGDILDVPENKTAEYNRQGFGYVENDKLKVEEKTVETEETDESVEEDIDYPFKALKIKKNKKRGE